MIVLCVRFVTVSIMFRTFVAKPTLLATKGKDPKRDVYQFATLDIQRAVLIENRGLDCQAQSQAYYSNSFRQGKYNRNWTVPDTVRENGLTKTLPPLPHTHGPETGKVASIMGSNSLHRYHVRPIGQSVSLITHGLTKGQRKGKEL